VAEDDQQRDRADANRNNRDEGGEHGHPRPDRAEQDVPAASHGGYLPSGSRQ
jgi:hypothetical protein